MIFTLSKEVEEKLRELSDKKGLALSDLVRRAIEVYYEKEKNEKTGA